MLIEPEQKRAVGFFDGQNLYRHAKAAFGHYHPNFDPKNCSMRSVCGRVGQVAVFDFTPAFPAQLKIRCGMGTGTTGC